MPGGDALVLPRTRVCPRCDYDRTGLEDGRTCPECGFEIEAGLFYLPCWNSRNGDIGWASSVIGGVIAFTATTLLAIGLNLIHVQFYFLLLAVGAILMLSSVQRLTARAFKFQSRQPEYWMVISESGVEIRGILVVIANPTPWSAFSGYRLKRLRGDRYRLKLQSEDLPAKWKWMAFSLHFEAKANLADELEAILVQMIN